MIKPIAWSLAGFVLIASGSFIGWDQLQMRRSLQKADALVNKGYAALAADIIDPYRHRLAEQDKTCAKYIVLYSNARRWDRVESMSQECLDSKIEVQEAYEGLASVRDMQGATLEAIKILESAHEKFRTASMKRNLIRVSIKAGDYHRPIALYFDLINESPKDSALIYEAVKFFSDIGKWGEAKMIAQNLQGVESTDPNVFLTLARVMKNVKENKAALELIENANRLIAALPKEQQTAFKKKYNDVYTNR